MRTTKFDHHNVQTEGVIREYVQALKLGAIPLANRIFDANPDLQKQLARAATDANV